MSGDYFSRPEMSQSRLKDFAVSPAYYQLRLKQPQEQTEAMAIGSAVHAALLEPEVFKKNYVCINGVYDKRTKAGKENWALFCEENEGKEILSEREYDQIIRMRDSVFEHPKANDVLSFDIEAEKEIFFELEGVPCKAKLDAIVPQINTVIDFKTARSSTAESFKRDAINMHYDLQAYWYYEAYKSLYGSYPDFYAFIVVSKEEPYPVGVFQVDGEFLDRGRYYALKYLRKFKECSERNVWPKNESEEVIEITTPEWAMREVMADENADAFFSTMVREFKESFFSTMTRE